MLTSGLLGELVPDHEEGRGDTGAQVHGEEEGDLQGTAVDVERQVLRTNNATDQNHL